MVVDELITLLGLETDPKAKKEGAAFGKLLGTITAAAVTAGAALTAAAGAITAYADRQSKAIDEQGKFADSIGVAFRALQELEYAQQSAGGSTEELRGDLEKLTKTMSSPVPGEYNQTLYQLGINARDSAGKLRSADAVLLDIAAKFDGMSKQRQIQFAEKLGITPGTVKLLQQGTGGIAALRKEAVDLGLVLDNSAKEQAARYQGSLLRVRSVVDALGKSISVALLPAMADTLDTFSKWIGANRDFIAGGIKQVVDGVALGFSMFGDAVQYVYGLIMGFLGPVDSLVAGLDATQAIAITVTAALTAMAVAALSATWPFIAIGAAIGALILIAEDLYAAIKGQPSLIGEWVAAFQSAYPGISGVISGILDLLQSVVQLLVAVLVPAFQQTAAGIAAAMSFVLETIKDILGAIESIISGSDPFEVLGDLFLKQVNRILDLAKTLGKGVLGIIDGVFGTSLSAPAAAAAPIPASIIQGGSGGSTVNNNVTQNINGAGNPRAVAQESVSRMGINLQATNPGMTGPVTY